MFGVRSIDSWVSIHNNKTPRWPLSESVTAWGFTRRCQLKEQNPAPWPCYSVRTLNRFLSLILGFTLKIPPVNSGTSKPHEDTRASFNLSRCLLSSCCAGDTCILVRPLRQIFRFEIWLTAHIPASGSYELPATGGDFFFFFFVSNHLCAAARWDGSCSLHRLPPGFISPSVAVSRF